MILKIRNGKVEDGPKRSNWRLVDGISELSYDIVKKPKDISTNTRIFHYTDLDETIELHIIMNDGKDVIIYTDQDCFVLNNDGKTTQSIYNPGNRLRPRSIDEIGKEAGDEQ